MMAAGTTKMNCKRLTKWLLTVLLVLTAPVAAYAQNESDVDWLIDALKLEEGSVVADIGAGDGRISLALARHVEPSGKVYSTELGADSVQYLQNVVNNASVSNITVVKGLPNRTNLPEACCNALFMRRVYHHIEDPATMNKSIRQSLKPGGRIAIIDFAPRGEEEADSDSWPLGPDHGVTKEKVIAEFRQAGFTLISSKQGSGRNFYVVMQKEE